VHLSTRNDAVDNELRVVAALCTRPPRNIVEVLRLGKLTNSDVYFIDMELCDFNLFHYIRRQWKDGHYCIRHLSTLGELSASAQLSQIHAILLDLVYGLRFIHSQAWVHRDLKPPNGDNTR
jgi:serine/threonine protein kinase